MEYIAYIFFGTGLILILAGFLRNQKETSDFPASKRKESSPAPSPRPYTAPSSPSPAPAPTSTVSPADKGPSFNIVRENPVLYKKEGYLYIDQSGANRYGNAEAALIANPENLNGIRRYGESELNYDGFRFVFRNEDHQETVALSSLSQISFYPNCVTLTRSENGHTILFFVDESGGLRRVLETFQAKHGS